MKTINFVLAGLGGQGILFMTKILASTALAKGYRVMGAETHGMAQRGGSVVSHLRLGNIESSLVKNGSAHFLLALEENEAYRNLPFLRKGGALFSDAASQNFPRADVRDYLNEMEIVCHGMDAARIALDMGAPLSSNLALIGFFAAFPQAPFEADEIRRSIEQFSPDRFRDINLRIFAKGLASGQNTDN